MSRLPQQHRTPLPLVLAWLFAALLAASAGYADGQQVATSGPVRKTGLLPPAIVLFEEQAGVKPMARTDWSSAAADAVSAAFIAELAARHENLAAIGKDELGPVDLSRLYDVPERIARDDGRPVPEQLLAVEYPAASVAAVLERHQLDTAWVLSGIALLPAAGSPSSGTAAVTEQETSVRKRLLLRAALVDRQGKVLYSDIVDNSYAVANQVPQSVDLRDPQVARRSAKMILTEYRTKRDQRDAEQAVVRAQEAKAAEQREREQNLRAGPPELRVGLGIFFVAPDGVDLFASYRPAGSRWQFGYRYVRWTDSFDDPFTGNALTETTDTMQGPQVNYLFTPEDTTSWYLGLSVLRWSRTEVSLMTGASDSDSVVAPFFGGGWTAHLGKLAYFNIGMFLSPGAELKTNTGVSSEEQSGGFDIQLQLGVVF